MAAGQAQATVRFSPYVGVSLTYVDNIDLAVASADKNSDLVAQLTPGFSFEQSNEKLKTTVDYGARGLFSTEDSDRNETFHQLSANSTATLLDRYFYFDANARYAQQVIDPARPANTIGIFENQNLADVAAIEGAPRFTHEYSWASVNAGYLFGRINYRDRAANGVDLPDANEEKGLLEISSPDNDARLGWNFTYNHEVTDYTGLVKFVYDEATFEGSYRIVRDLELLAQAGAESDITESLSDGGLDRNSWAVGFRIRPSRNAMLQAMIGERFYGRSYDFKAQYSGRRMRLDATYTEGPSTAAAEFGAGGAPSLGNTPPTTVDDLTRLDAGVFLRKDFEGTLTLTGRVTEIAVTALDWRRDYLTLPISEHTTGISAAVMRRLTTRTSATVDISRRELNDTRAVERSYHEMLYRIILNRQFTNRISGSMQASRSDRKGVDSPYTVNWISVALQATF
jgi:hypothetical protein